MDQRERERSWCSPIRLPTISTCAWVLLLSLIAIGLVLHSVNDASSTTSSHEFGVGGGPPGTAAVVAPPGSFTHRLRSSWKVLKLSISNKKNQIKSSFNHLRGR